MPASFKTTKALITEDWAVVLLGLLIIGVVLSGLSVTTPKFDWSNSEELLHTVFSAENSRSILGQFVFAYTVALAGTLLIGRSLRATALGFPVVFMLTLAALVLTGNRLAKGLNLEVVIFSLLLGLLIGNISSLPAWLKASLATETFVKLGLVLLGTTIIFGDILKAGSLGLLQAFIVVVSVWYFAFWISRKLRVDDEMAIMLSSAVSICGVSAAIASSGAIEGDNKKLSYVISLVLVTAIPMMLAMPYAAESLGLSPQVTGAWLGGTIDTSGAVVAAGSLAGDEALKISTIVKFSQNVLLGVAAFAISVYWTYTKHKPKGAHDAKPSLGVIWERFPKFILGFLAASLIFSLALSQDEIDNVKGPLKSFQSLWFALAFTSIGLETRIADLFRADNRRALYAFLIAQSFNILVTLVVAYILFS